MGSKHPNLLNWWKKNTFKNLLGLLPQTCVWEERLSAAKPYQAAQVNFGFLTLSVREKPGGCYSESTVTCEINSMKSWEFNSMKDETCFIFSY